MADTPLSMVNQGPPTRLDRLLCELLPSDKVSRETAKGWIRDGLVRIEGKTVSKPGQKVLTGQQVELSPPPPPEPSLSPVQGEVDIIFQDEQLLVVSKAPGVTVHPAPGMHEPTLIQFLAHRFPDIAAMEGERPGIVHRIDKGTSGLLVVARTKQASTRLAQAFAGRDIRKKYLAIVQGVPEPQSGTIDAPMGRHPSLKTRMAVVAKGGKEALSAYQTLLACPEKGWSLQEVRIHTGRTHQIRVHMAHIGHPLLGDSAYGGPRSLDTHPALAARPMLHAFQLAFTHPGTGGPMAFTQPPPKDFTALLLALHRRVQRIVVTGLPGSGKSSLAKELHSLGLPLFSADQAVRELYEPYGDGWTYLHNRFGGRFTGGESGDTPVDKAKLFQAMIREPLLRQEVEQAVHPMVFVRLQHFWEENRNARAAVAEIPLYFEAGQETEPRPDLVVGVYCPAGLRRARARTRGLDPSVIDTLDSWQWPEQAKLNHCHLVLDNAHGLDHLKQQAVHLFSILQDLRRDRVRSFLARLDPLLKTGD